MVKARLKTTPTSAEAKAALLRHCIIPADIDDCWRWSAAKKETGYGRIRFRNQEYIASRLSYAVHSGVDPKGLDVMHSCDNPECCNPRHLSTGTHQDNMADAKSKGRKMGPMPGGSVNVGEDNGMSILSNKQRQEIRRLYNIGWKQREIADLFEISRSHVSTLVRGCVDRRPLKKRKSELFAMFEDGLGNQEIAKHFGVHHSAVSKYRQQWRSNA